MANITVTFADGQPHTYQNVPDNITPEQIEQRASQDFAGRKIQHLERKVEEQIQPEQPQQQPNILERFGRAAAQTGAGLAKGAADIGATILTPFDVAGLSAYTPQQRRAALEQFAQEQSSPAFTAGEITSQIAGTAGAGGLLGAGARRIAPLVPEMAAALETGGIGGEVSKGMLGAAQRIGGGAVTGGAMGGMVSPDDTTSGTVIGAALPAGVQTATRLIPKVAKEIVGVTTGAGATPFEEAFKAGKTGGEKAKSFRENIGDKVLKTDVLEDAKQNIQAMAAQKSAAYKEGIGKVSDDKSVLSFEGIDKSMKNAYDMATYKGQVKNLKAAQSLQKTFDAIAEWKSLNPTEFHTPEGLDALKQNIGGILESIPYEEKTARSAVGQIYNSIKNEISKQAPAYADTMKDYSKATEQISEIERALSLGTKASEDTAMRKLQSLMRNNVSTNYGVRQALAKQMEQQGGREIMPALAGQALSEFAPRGMARVGSGMAAGGAFLNPATLAALPITSPRLMGEAAYGAGAITRGGNRLADLLRSKSIGADVALENLPLAARAGAIQAGR